MPVDPVQYAPAAIAALGGVGALVVSRRKTGAETGSIAVATANQVVTMLRDELGRLAAHVRECETALASVNAQLDALRTEMAHNKGDGR